MKTILRKSLTLLVALLVIAGGFLAFTTERVEAAGTRTIYVCQKGLYIANLCIKNRSKSNHKKCTGNVPVGSRRDLTFRWDRGDDLAFIAAVKDGHNGYYEPIANRDDSCWSDGSPLNPGVYCRSNRESEC